MRSSAWSESLNSAVSRFAERYLNDSDDYGDMPPLEGSEDKDDIPPSGGISGGISEVDENRCDIESRPRFFWCSCLQKVLRHLHHLPSHDPSVMSEHFGHQWLLT